jgi:hypothetical protein
MSDSVVTKDMCMLGFGVSSARGGIKPRLQGLIYGDGMAATQAVEVYTCLSSMGGRCVVYKQGENSEVKAEVLASGRSVSDPDHAYIDFTSMEPGEGRHGQFEQRGDGRTILVHNDDRCCLVWFGTALTVEATRNIATDQVIFKDDTHYLLCESCDRNGRPQGEAVYVTADRYDEVGPPKGWTTGISPQSLQSVTAYRTDERLNLVDGKVISKRSPRAPRRLGDRAEVVLGELHTRTADKTIAGQSWVGRPFTEMYPGVSEEAYGRVVKVPMDLATVATKLEQGAYTGDGEVPSDMKKDLELIFRNAIAWNRKTNCQDYVEHAKQHLAWIQAGFKEPPRRSAGNPAAAAPRKRTRAAVSPVPPGLQQTFDRLLAEQQALLAEQKTQRQVLNQVLARLSTAQPAAAAATAAAAAPAATAWQDQPTLELDKQCDYCEKIRQAVRRGLKLHGSDSHCSECKALGGTPEQLKAAVQRVQSELDKLEKTGAAGFKNVVERHLYFFVNQADAPQPGAATAEQRLEYGERKTHQFLSELAAKSVLPKAQAASLAKAERASLPAAQGRAASAATGQSAAAAAPAATGMARGPPEPGDEAAAAASTGEHDLDSARMTESDAKAVVTNYKRKHALALVAEDTRCC